MAAALWLEKVSWCPATQEKHSALKATIIPAVTTTGLIVPRVMGSNWCKPNVGCSGLFGSQLLREQVRVRRNWLLEEIRHALLRWW